MQDTRDPFAASRRFRKYEILNYLQDKKNPLLEVGYAITYSDTIWNAILFMDTWTMPGTTVPNS